MSLPESVKTQLQEKLREQNTLAPENIDTFITSLEQNKDINWNLLLNAELEKGGDDEADA